MSSTDASDLQLPRTRPATAVDYVQLMKPRIMMLVVFTALAGLVAAQSVTGVSINPVMAGIATLAVALGSGAAGAINMWYDADIDSVMKRTSTRPIPSGAVPRDEALAMGLIMSGVSVLLMWLASNALAAGLLALSIAYYGWFYTMLLKRRTPQNIVVGGAAGAFPPVIGWAAVTGSTTLDAWLLFAIIFFWTPPHFWALSLYVTTDYAKAGVPMLPVVKGAKETRKQILIYSLILIPICLAPVLTGLGGPIYLAVAGLGGAVFLILAWRVFASKAGDAADPRVADRALYDVTEDEKAAGAKAARNLFAFSILYLFAMFAALLGEAVSGVHALELLK